MSMAWGTADPPLRLKGFVSQAYPFHASQRGEDQQIHGPLPAIDRPT
jgi:hypothetical protein